MRSVCQSCSISRWDCITILNRQKAAKISSAGETELLRKSVPAKISRYTIPNVAGHTRCNSKLHSLAIKILLAMHHVDSSCHLPLQNGTTPLMVASYAGHPSVVRVLLQAGAHVNTTSRVRYSSCQIVPYCGFGWEMYMLTLQAHFSSNLQHCDNMLIGVRGQNTVIFESISHSRVVASISYYIAYMPKHLA